jgi:hypothetical protein
MRAPRLEQGDEALCEYTAAFDGMALDPAGMRLDPERARAIASRVDAALAARRDRERARLSRATGRVELGGQG